MSVRFGIVWLPPQRWRVCCKAEFVQLLRHMADSTKKAKAFAKKLYEDYRSKTCNIGDAYRRFDEFTAEVAEADPSRGSSLGVYVSVCMLSRACGCSCVLCVRLVQPLLATMFES